ncbi:hypothetical protein [Bacillus mycoides]|uniref:hypothetical protein n=1 Tax=Bacillus mycoides TaxID=1405 RepID=UPI001659A2DD|nr:hypothetical protein [Bacillus mycoides]
MTYLMSSFGFFLVKLKVNFYVKVYIHKDRKSSEATTVLGRENEILRPKTVVGISY